MSEILAQVEEAVNFLKSKYSGPTPRVGIILGTGLGALAEHLDSTSPKLVIPFKDIPHFAKPTAQFHAGNLIFSTLNGIPVVCMEGRFHVYDGCSGAQITHPVRVMAKLGIHSLVVSNAAGCLIKDWKVGDIALISDHVNLTGCNPLMGPNPDLFPPHSQRFIPMNNCYDNIYRDIAKDVAKKRNQIVREGIYVPFNGPSFETWGEYNLAIMAGASMVGMSSAPEVIVARHCGLRVLGFSVLTDMCGPGISADAADIYNQGTSISQRLIPLLFDIIPLIDKEGGKKD